MGGDSNIIDMGVIIEGSQEYWLNCLAQFELALQEEMDMAYIAPKGFNDNTIQLLKFEIEECTKQLT